MSKIKWLYKGKELPNRTPTSYGFIYVIEYTTGELYVGKRQFFSIKTMQPLKSGEQRDGGVFFNKIVNHKRVTLERVKVENSWREYIGSSKRGKGLKVKSKTILHICNDSLNLSYWETYYLFVLDVLRNDMYLNDNIGGKFFSPKIV